ncbi:uncharacterized protein N7473_011043 [Penicillium subrubescens]|uniref:uncharacterized protein n=1 Tax=Penicillium subrubescens TaxID=1316194 RepID=UPI0025452D1C|nr:uncharacterized protein N7473_011043 [Penicillium subrubescens]KAJ5882781.1 hypothetical protein N7473_011043 [Penicillium subrubescens]
MATVALGSSLSPLIDRDHQTSSLISPSSATIWTAYPSDGIYTTSGFGGFTEPSGSGDTYVGNVGKPYGSNIIIIPPEQASKYKYALTVEWTGGMVMPRRSFALAAGQTKYVAFAPNSQGGWAMTKAASIPKDQYGGYASTWGEFDFGSTENDGWSGFDVSAIQAQYAQLEVQGMQICSALNKGLCSYITKGAKVVHNAYIIPPQSSGALGATLLPGPVRLAVEIGFEE